MWAAMGRDIFASILKHALDGRDAVRFGSTCTLFRALFAALPVEHIAKYHARIHYIVDYTCADVPHAYMSDNHTAGEPELYTLLMQQHGFDLRKFWAMRDRRWSRIILQHSPFQFGDVIAQVGPAPKRAVYRSGMRYTVRFAVDNPYELVMDPDHLEWVRDNIFPGTFDWRTYKIPFEQDVFLEISFRARDEPEHPLRPDLELMLVRRL
jgi:hypothetical protein